MRLWWRFPQGCSTIDSQSRRQRTNLGGVALGPPLTSGNGTCSGALEQCPALLDIDGALLHHVYPLPPEVLQALRPHTAALEPLTQFHHQVLAVLWPRAGRCKYQHEDEDRRQGCSGTNPVCHFVRHIELLTSQFPRPCVPPAARSTSFCSPKARDLRAHAWKPPFPNPSLQKH